MPGFADNHQSGAPSDAGAPPIIKVRKVTKQFGSLIAVSETSFDIFRGRIVGLVGSDGAGKTTLLRMIATMTPPTSGSIRVDDFDVGRQKDAVKKLIGYMPQRFGLYQDLTVAENLDFFMDIFGISGLERSRRQERYLGFSNLLPFLDRKAGDLSGGMKQKLGLACVLVHQPRILILDEPTNGVDPVSRKEFWEILTEMRHQGMTILVATAYLDEGEMCDGLVLMHDSRVLAEATPAELMSGFADLEEGMIQRILQVDATLREDDFAV
ncbi:MAG: ABC transporter ATP-binding protein [Desulfobacterales bacterium]|nr:MAG: ABC transporter ATP-binding protein [Desulfobacterales bacterium]